MLLALTRDVSPAFDRCEVTSPPPTPIDVAEARRQHSRYKQTLLELGCHVISLPAATDLPDSVFVEDTAVVLDELVVITRPGATSRRAETKAVMRFMSPYRKPHTLEEPATLDGGDVLRIGKTLFVGQSIRTNQAGIEQLEASVSGAGYKVRAVPLRGGLHLKSAVSRLGERLLLVNPDWVDPAEFGNFEVIEVDRDEPYAANALRLGDHVIYPAQFRNTTPLIKEKGFKIRPVEMSEFLKADGGVTCGSIIFSHPPDKASQR